MNCKDLFLRILDVVLGGLYVGVFYYFAGEIGAFAALAILICARTYKPANLTGGKE